MRIRLTTIALAVAITLGGTSRIHAQDRAAKTASDRHLARGLAHFAQHEYDRAMAEFRRGYAALPRREFLFALGQAERLSGDCASAIIYYERFLSRNPPPVQARAAQAHRTHCRAAIGSGPAAGRHRGATARGPAKSAPPRPRRAKGLQRTRPWYRDHATGALLVGTTLSAGLAMALFASSKSAQSDARNATDYGEHAAAVDRAYLRRNIGFAALFAAGGLGAGAAYRLLRGPRAESRAPSVTLTPRPGGASVGVVGRF